MLILIERPILMIKITIFRHGETNWNKKKLIQGTTNIPLNITGLGQAFQLAEQLKGKKIDLILSSDLSRAHQTARVATKHLDKNIPFVISPKLRELNFGEYEGKDVSSFNSLDILPILDDFEHPETFNVRFPKGESHGELLSRVLQCLEDNINNYPFALNIVIFTHYGVMRALTKYLTKESKIFKNADSLELVYDLNEAKLKLVK